MRILDILKKFKNSFRKKGNEFWGISENMDPMNTECKDWHYEWQLSKQYMIKHPDDVGYAECYKRTFELNLTQCRDCLYHSSGKCDVIHVRTIS